MTGSPRALASVIAAFAVLAAAPVLAQVGDAREALANADFERAIRIFDEAERGPLERAEYLDLLEGRALASWASGHADRARTDVAALAAIDPDHAFPPETPPELTEAFAAAVAAREGPIAAHALFRPSGDALTVAVRNDDLGLVARVRAHIRASGGEWSVAEAEPGAAEFPIRTTRAEAWVELLGHGGAVLVTAGTQARPIVWDPAGALSADRAGGADDSALWIGLGVGGAVLLIAAIVIGVVLAVSSQPAGGAQPEAPVVVGF